jgi:hypothetical protein
MSQELTSSRQRYIVLLKDGVDKVAWMAANLPRFDVHVHPGYDFDPAFFNGFVGTPATFTLLQFKFSTLTNDVGELNASTALPDWGPARDAVEGIYEDQEVFIEIDPIRRRTRAVATQ